MQPQLEPETSFERSIRRLKRNPLIALILLVAAVVGGLAAFTNSLQTLWSWVNGQSAAPPAVRLFQSRPEQIHAGESATMEWNVDNAESVEIDGGIGMVALSGRREVTPSATTTYTLTARNGNLVATQSTTVHVAQESALDGTLVLNDVFVGDAGWKQPPDPVFRGSIGGGRFLMEWVENRSAQCVTRDLAIGAGQDFSIQVTANSVQPTGFALGLCWTTAGGRANYKLYVDPGTASPGKYLFVRDETWSQVTADGQSHPYGQSVNLLDPSDVNHTFAAAAINPGTSANVISVIRRGDKVKIFINNQFVNQAEYTAAPVESVGMFISGQLAAEFRDFSVRVAQ